MTAARASAVRRLRGLGNISWLTSRQLDKLAGALVVSSVERRGVISEDKNTNGSAYVLLSGVARISCRNRKGLRTLLMMVAPGMVPGFPPRVVGITYDFRCEAVTNCQVGTISLEKFIEISLGIDSDDFKRMATSYLGRWDLVQLRCSNFMSCTLEERLALILLELSEHFGIRNGKGIRLTVHARHRDIAELVGASRPRITEHLIEFEEKHLITREDHQFTVHRDRIESFLAQSHPAIDSRISKAATP
ncbi:MAG TPA: Crp/Fnr family transcriptional regulator [Sporolactobacillaceae bacterium]|nr:Crp/Fnr family transcriptional regulator [Sporolactobacillaceae bacterium]